MPGRIAQVFIAATPLLAAAAQGQRERWPWHV